MDPQLDWGEEPKVSGTIPWNRETRNYHELLHEFPGFRKNRDGSIDLRTPEERERAILAHQARIDFLVAMGHGEGEVDAGDESPRGRDDRRGIRDD